MKKYFFIIFVLILWSIESIFWSENLEHSNIENLFIQNNTNSPKFDLSFQNPSYLLDKDNTSKIIYFCDLTKDTCKINFKLTQIETTSSLSSKLQCKFITTFESDQFERCNPNTVIFPQWIHPVNITVTENNNSENFTNYDFIIVNGEVDNDKLKIEKDKILKKINPTIEEKTIQNLTKIYSWEATIQNIISDEVRILTTSQPSPQGEGVTNELSSHWGGDTDKDTQTNTQLQIPDFQYILQSPSYILETDEENVFICDQSKWDECKVNFKLLDLQEKDISSKFECEISLSTEGFSPLNKCNPNTIIFPEWNNEVIFKIFEKWNRENFREEIIWINNEFSSSISDSSPQPSPQGEGVTNELSSPWGEDTDEDLTEKHYLPPTKIQVQWKIWKTKKVWITRMTCYTYSECSINFTSGKIYKSQREWINFRWDFWNGEKYSDYNPKSIKFSPWEYKVKLTVTNDFWDKKVEIYRVKVINLYTKTEIKNINKTIESITDFSLEEQFLKNLTTHSPNTNKILNQYIGAFEDMDLSSTISFLSNVERKSHPPLGTSHLNKEATKQQKALAKNMSLRVTFQKKNLKVYWTSEPLSEISLKIWEKEFKQQTDSQWNYTFKINTLNSWIYKIQATVMNSQWKIVAQKTSAEKEFTKGYLTQLNSYKQKLITRNQEVNKDKASKEINNKKLLAKNISLRVSLQKKNLKLYWTTQAHSNIIFTIWYQTFTTLSNNEWKYELKTNFIQVWKYKIIASVYNSWKLVAKKSSSTKTFSSEYIQNMRSYLTKNTSSNTSKSSKVKKFTLENFIPQTPDFVISSAFNIKVFVINMLIAILSLILLFIVMIKRKLI